MYVDACLYVYLGLRMSGHVYVCIYVIMCIMSICMYGHVCLCMSTYPYVCLRMPTYAHECLYTTMYVYVCLYVCRSIQRTFLYLYVCVYA